MQDFQNQQYLKSLGLKDRVPKMRSTPKIVPAYDVSICLLGLGAGGVALLGGGDANK